MKVNWMKLVPAIVLTASIGLSGCAKEQSVAEPAAQQPKNDPVKLSVYHNGGDLSDDEFKRYFVEPVAKKYPYITLELVRTGGGKSPQELLASNSFPDIVFTSNGGIPRLQPLNVIEDITPYIKKNSIDLNRFQKVGIDLVKAYDPNKMLAIPVTFNLAALIYNKDIFDKFAVSYPKDNMSWDDVVKLSKSLTRNEGGAPYVGLDLWRVDVIGTQMALPLVDPKTNKATFDNESWKKVLSLFKDTFDIPGYINDKKIDYDFFKDNLAMFPIWATQIASWSTTTDRTIASRDNWDLVTLPYFKGFEGKGRTVDAHVLLLSSLSKHKDEAFKVIMEVASDEVQMTMAKWGRVSPLKDESFKASYLTQFPVMKNRNIKALFGTTPLDLPPPSVYESIARPVIQATKQKLALEKADMNTLLREAQEEADKKIAEEMKK